MNTYLVPTTNEFEKTFANIMVVYAESQKEAYKKAEMRRGLVPFTVQRYTDEPYETFIKKFLLQQNTFLCQAKMLC